MKKAVNVFFLFVFVFTVIILSCTVFYADPFPKKLYFEKEEDIALSPFLTLGESVCAATSKNAPETKKVMLFESIPVGEVELIKTERAYVIPGGEPIGIKLLSKGVLVVKLGSIDGVCPASDCGIRVGDIILSVNGEEVSSNEDIEKLIKNSGEREVKIKLLRDGAEKNFCLTPVFSKQDGCPKAGLWVRDSSAGIGTMTFYSPDTSGFAGLGHPICDADTGEIFNISKGSVCSAEITGFRKAEKDLAGELEGSFINGDTDGVILKNSDCGIYGTLDDCTADKEAVPIAFKQEVKKGSATVLTTVNGTEPEEYSCEIEEIRNDGTKNLVIRITDKRLLEKTGGILQGMSGSPILQNGKLVGAITHVMLDSSDTGYGIFAETMQNELNSAVPLEVESNNAA